MTYLSRQLKCWAIKYKTNLNESYKTLQYYQNVMIKVNHTKIEKYNIYFKRKLIRTLMQG